MTFQPIVPLSGYMGWKFLERTKESQQSVFNESSVIRRNSDYFRQNFGSVSSAEELVSDRRLLSVALGAFGLDDDIGNKFFIKRVLADGISNDDALSNKLSDKRYYALAKTFGFGEAATSELEQPGFADKIISAFQTKQFEIAVGDQNENLRLALNVDSALDDLYAKDLSDNGAWFQIMGTPTLRNVFSEALGMSTSLASLDLDRQLDEFRSRSERIFGNGEVEQFSSRENREKLVRKFLIQTEIQSGIAAYSSGSIALALLQS